MAEAHALNGHNLLLKALTSGQNGGKTPPLELIPLGLKQILYEPDEPIRYVYFPVDGVLSLLAQLGDDLEIEVGTVGNEGMVGLPLFLGTETTPGRAFSQVPGHAYRFPAADFKDWLRHSPRMTAVLQRYTQALMIQISQGTACNSAHSNVRRCARWLLMTQDRVHADEFTLTQEFLSQMLGVRRATVSDIAAQFQADGIISYSRGTVRVLDRARLEAASCQCYGIIRKEYDRMYQALETA